jgi:Flp pilus assembly protein TadB
VSLAFAALGILGRALVYIPLASTGVSLVAVPAAAVADIRRRRRRQRRFAAAAPVILRAMQAGDPSRQTLRRDQ